MENLNVGLLKALCETPGAPGFEKKVRDLVIEQASGWADELTVDNLGNVSVLMKGRHNPEGKKVMLAAHMDEIGFIVTHIDEGGFLRFHTLGGFDPKTLTAQRVIVHGTKDLVGVMGSKPIHVMSQEERGKMPKTTDYFIDLGMKRDEVAQYVKVGDPITRERELVEMGDCVNCKSLDNRVSVFILLEALKRLKNAPYDVYGVFTVQEEVGLRGASVAAHTIDPDFGIAIDTTIAYDVPGAQPHEQITALGEGAAIKIMDGSVISDYRMVDFLKAIANQQGVKWQPEILTAGGTDTAGVQRMGKRGAISGAVSIPTRHLHQVIEMAHKQDIAHCIRLIVGALENIDKHNWEH
jgi:putative aminopeptidase FrvX